MSKSIAIVIGLFGLANAACAGVTDLSWMTGHWCGTNGGIYNEEVWLAPRAGSMVGMHRDSKDAKFVGFEFFRIVEDGTNLVYWTQPSGKPAVAFHAKLVNKNSVEFLNPTHDFPQRIRYRRVDARTLHARIDNGSDKGSSMEWTWHLDCR